jgi:hypothetical protein
VKVEVEADEALTDENKALAEAMVLATVEVGALGEPQADELESASTTTDTAP